MDELALKYGCNPNQKPARIFMADGSNLPVVVWTRSTAGSS
jgi:phosphoribosylaminoimidazolecarboxamide formyltransferase/IMP cyclohydrolase